jgi:hypothetical protein
MERVTERTAQRQGSMLSRVVLHAPSRSAARRVVDLPLSSRFFSAKPAEEPAAEKSSEVPPKKTDVDSLPVQFADISRAHVAIRNGVVRTECKKSHFISELGK